MTPRPGWQCLCLLAAGLALAAGARAAPPADMSEWSGRQLMEQVYRRHRQYPYVYEEQSVVLQDRDGHRETRLARRYSRIETDGTVKFLLIFTAPREVRGVSLLARRETGGDIYKAVYLPAFGRSLIQSSSAAAGENFLGTDFTLEDLTGEDPDAYRYLRRRNTRLDGVEYCVVDVYARGADPVSARALRRHFILRDNLFPVRTDYFDGLGRLRRQLTRHDLQRVDGDMWRANMILMQDLGEGHQTLIKIDRRVYSRDYVPAEMFTANWLFDHYPGTAPGAEDGDGDANEAGTAAVMAEGEGGR